MNNNTGIYTKAQNGNLLAVAKWLVPLALSALVAYLTAMGALESRMSVLEDRQRQNFHEIQRSLDRIERDVRELRGQLNTPRLSHRREAVTP